MPSRRGPTLRALGAGALLAALACDRGPRVGGPTGPPPLTDTQVLIQQVVVDAATKVEVTFQVLTDQVPVGAGDLAALAPSFTLAALVEDPGSGLDAWASLLLTGRQVVPTTGQPQPGVDSGGLLVALPDGSFRYTFSVPLPASLDGTIIGPATTLRVGLFLRGAGSPTLSTSVTRDFTRSGLAPGAQLETTLDADCSRCHGLLRLHGGVRVGVRLCLTCHTYQNFDPDTVDPAAPAGTSAAVSPNPLDLGRLVHRIHRGKNLPTLYLAGVAAGNTPVFAATNVALVPPFRVGGSVLDPALRRFSIVGYQQGELLVGAGVNRTDNGQPPLPVAEGIAFPRDLRDCDVCHAGAPQAGATATAISRRTCQGCHPDVWFASGAVPDRNHLLHPGGVQLDDTHCTGCHVAGPNVIVPIADVHVTPARSSHFNRLRVEILSVGNLVPGGTPIVSFNVADADGPIVPTLTAPSPSTSAATTSPLPRALESLAIVVSGPTRDVLTGNLPPASEPAAVNAIAAAVNGVYTYTLATPIPATATGTWSVGMSVRRRGTPASFDAVTQTFAWPYTGEPVTEWGSNPVVAVALDGGPPTPRRAVVDQQKCERCHLELNLHGSNRHDVAYCLLCHGPDQTDWGRRPRTIAPAGTNQLNTDLAATFDGIEERSVHFKVLIHRIHTGAHRGSATLELVQPFLVYGFNGSRNFFDDVEFPNQLADCTACHLTDTWTIEAIPPDADPTTANETASIRHQGTAAHGAGEGLPPITAACLGCHASSVAAEHAGRYTSGTTERCASCHGARGTTSVRTAHGL